MSRRAASRSCAPTGIAGVLAITLGATGCGGTSTGAVLVDDGVAVVDAWVRPTPTGAEDAAIYISLELRGGPDSALLGATSDRCMVVQPHATEIDDTGVASMGEALDEQLRLTPDHDVVMEPNGTHLMCLGVTEPLVDGEQFAVTIDLDGRSAIDVPVTVEQRF